MIQNPYTPVQIISIAYSLQTSFLMKVAGSGIKKQQRRRGTIRRIFLPTNSKKPTSPIRLHKCLGTHPTWKNTMPMRP